ncbi:SMI1/KNR4 family protein [Pedobacter hiemivivus]|uniref:SMI1/KNR4 family protein n=1 Tax=Pedobacter hiemivivus TaxID=2530454 RepID=A0A4R0NK44_9SPHI|nr:SMI1/KNR4 family protein [Pedobacter hiemivivus]TCC99693.1 SMI1/KNR4 family protein [Pedobacter hiemivivus]
MVKDNFRIIEILEQYQFPVTDVQALESFGSRDGFQRITNENLEGMVVFFKQYPEDFDEVLPIMTDDNSNYFCVYYKGDYKGKVCHLSHDEIDLTPRFKSIESLIHVIRTHPQSWDFGELPERSFDF